MANFHPAARHAFLGVSAQLQANLLLINPKNDRELATQYRTTALANFQRAMKCLAQSRASEIGCEVMLTCCILFAAGEIWPQEHMVSHIHILNGLKICKENLVVSLEDDTFAGYLLRVLLHLAENLATFNDDFTEFFAPDDRGLS